MAINKVVNKSTKSHGAMRNVIEYVLRDDKVKQGFVEITGPYAADTINYDDVYKPGSLRKSSGIKIPAECMLTTSSAFTKLKSSPPLRFLIL